jgi:serine/threonine-protein kinase
MDTQHHHGRLVGTLAPEHVLLLPNGYVHILIRKGGAVATTSGRAHDQRRHALADMTHSATPEETRGEPHGPSTDIWLLGALMYESLTGRPPFAGLRRSALLEQIACDDPAQLTGDAACIQDVMDRALARWPTNRYRSAQELANAFWAALPYQELEMPPLIGAKAGALTESPAVQLSQAADRPLRDGDRPTAGKLEPARRPTAGRRRILRLIQQMSSLGIADAGAGAG